MKVIDEFAILYALNAVWLAALLSCATWTVAKLLHGASAGVVHRLWLFCLALVIILPAIPLLHSATPAREYKAISVIGSLEIAPTVPSSFHEEATTRPELLGSARTDRKIETPAIAGSFSALAGTPSSSRSVDLASHASNWRYFLGCALLMAYWLSVIFALTKLGWGLSRTWALRRDATVVVLSEEMERTWQMCCNGYGLRTVRLLQTPRLTSPATMTFSSAAVLLPDRMCVLSASDLAAVFCHELAHVYRRDFLKNLLYELLAAPLFFHPAIHWIRRELEQTRELACDDLAASVLQGRIEYAGSLVRLAQQIAAAGHSTPGRALGVFEGNALERRVVNLIEAKARQTAGRVVLCAMYAAALLLASCVAATKLGLRPVLAKSVQAMKPPMRAVVIPIHAAAKLANATTTAVPEVAEIQKSAAENSTDAADPAEDAEATQVTSLAQRDKVAISAETAAAPVEPVAEQHPQSSIMYSGVPLKFPEHGDLKPVPFKLGNTYFEPGDSIVIDEIRGTSDTISDHNLYEIKGHYALQSHDDALLAASLTTSSAYKGGGNSPSLNMSVNKGSGRFSVWLFIDQPGEPHVSFYPSGGGNSFAGVYFKTDPSGLGAESSAIPKPNAEMPKGWFLGMSKPDTYIAGVDPSVTHAGQPSALLASSVEDSGGFGTFDQYFKAKDYLGKRVRLSAWVKSQSVAHWAGLWMRIDQDQKMISMDNMQDRGIKGTTEWKQYDVVLDVPQKATGIAMGVLLDGPGEIWISGVKVEVVGNEVAITGAPSHATPAAPVNLDFTR